MKKGLPGELLHALSNIEGFNKTAFEDVHYHSRQITAVRFNVDKYERFAGSSNITHPSFNLNEPIAWCEYGFYLDERPQFTFDPLLHAGAYYVQEASSMFLWQALKQLFERDGKKAKYQQLKQMKFEHAVFQRAKELYLKEKESIEAEKVNQSKTSKKISNKIQEMK